MATTRRKLPDEAGDAGLVGDRRDGLELVLAENTGLLIRRVRSALPSSSACEAVEIGLDLGHRIRLQREFEQRTRVAFCDT